jgi:hypothetical protein
MQLRSRAVVIAVVAVAAVAVATTRSGSAPVARPTVHALLTRPGAFVGERVSVVGRLDARRAGRVARLRERGGSGSLLIVARRGVALPAGRPLVVVTGTMDRLDEATGVTSSGGSDSLADNAPIIRAERIELARRPR